MVLFKTDYIEIKYHASKKLVETTWVGAPPSDEYRNAMKGAIAVIKTHDVHRWIGDYRQAVEIDMPDQEWVLDEWAPVFMSSTTKLVKMAKVTTKEHLTINQADTLSSKLGFQNSNQFAFQEFDDYEAAMKWITS